MSSRLQTLLDRMPRQYAHEEDSNNYKLLKMIAENGVENLKVQQTILKFWDVDQAEGVGLDRLGKDEGISRGSYDDETYRKFIKIEYFINMSTGDIETMNTILDAYMGDTFLGLEEGWGSYLKEPASLVVNIGDNAREIPHYLVRRIKPAAVRIYYAATIGALHGLIHHKAYTFPIYYPITHTFHAGHGKGAASKTAVVVESKRYTFKVPYSITGAFYCSDGKGVNPHDVNGGYFGEPYYLAPVDGGYFIDLYDQPSINGGDF